MIVEYSIVRGKSVTELTRNMRYALQDGFQPFGSITVDPIAEMYLQPVVMYDGITSKSIEINHGSQTPLAR